MKSPCHIVARWVAPIAATLRLLKSILTRFRYAGCCKLSIGVVILRSSHHLVRAFGLSRQNSGRRKGRRLNLDFSTSVQDKSSHRQSRGIAIGENAFVVLSVSG